MWVREGLHFERIKIQLVEEFGNSEMMHLSLDKIHHLRSGVRSCDWRIQPPWTASNELSNYSASSKGRPSHRERYRLHQHHPSRLPSYLHPNRTTLYDYQDSLQPSHSDTDCSTVGDQSTRSALKTEDASSHDLPIQE